MTPHELRQRLEEQYLLKSSFRHAPAQRIRLLPYVTHSPKTAAENELNSWLGLAGETARRLTRSRPTEDVTLEGVMARIAQQVQTDRLADLQQVVRRTAFDAAGNLLPFYNSVFRYLPIAKERTLTGLARLAGDVFLAEPEVLKYASFESPAGNVLYRLVDNSLPDLDHDSAEQKAEYYAIDVGLGSVFKRDWEFIWERKQEIRTSLPELLKFYLFQYQMRLAEKLDSFFATSHCRPLFFTLDWEKCSAGRKAYLAGWKSIEPKIRRLYSQVNCLELLNSIELPGLCSPYDYQALRDWLSQASQADIELYASLLEEITRFYRDGIAGLGFRWQDFDDKIRHEPWGHPVLDAVHYLWLLVDCQFRNSVRHAPAGRYASWAVTQALDNYGKQRGRIGHTLALSREQLMFLAWLTIGGAPKMRLHEFWMGLEDRGVAFDHLSRGVVVELLEKLNLLEKKSDSGDAQYVRAIV